MENILLIFICMFLGFLLKKSPHFPNGSHKVLNQFIIHISLPSIALYHIPKIAITSKLWFPIGIAWIGFLLSYLFFSILGKRLGWSRKLIGCMILMAGLGNTSFVGFPVIEAAYGKDAIITGILVDQPGSFLVLSTFAVLVASLYSRGEANYSQIVKKILFFPPFVAFVVACVFNLFSFDFDENLQLVFQKLGNTVTPIALVSVGMQLTFEKHSKHWRFLFLGLFFKIIITPAFFYFLYVFILNGTGYEVKVSLLESAMPPMITAAIVASSYGLKPKLSTMMIGFGIPISFVTLVFWYYIFQTI